MIKRKEPLIQFVSTIPGLSFIDECIPKPALKYIPDWWKETPFIDSTHTMGKVTGGNVKNCPSFMDYFSQGYVLPMWADTILSYDSETKTWAWKSADDKFKWSVHENGQYLNTVSHSFLGSDSYFIFKAQCPWRIITKPGYSTYQLPVFYHFNKDFSVLPGIRDSDTYHQINPQVVIHSDKKEIFIPRGTPLAQYVPFKREKNNGLVRDMEERDSLIFAKDDLRFSTKFTGSNVYVNDRK
jgi:hypothetical protein